MRSSPLGLLIREGGTVPTASRYLGPSRYVFCIREPQGNAPAARHLEENHLEAYVSLREEMMKTDSES